MKDKIINTLGKIIEKESVEKSKGYVFKIAMYKKALKAFQNANKANTYNNAVNILKTVFKNPKAIQNKLKHLYNNNNFVVNLDSETKAILVLSSVPQIGIVKAKSLVQDHGIKSIVMLKNNQHLLNNPQKLGLKYYDELIDPKSLKAHRIPRSEITKFKEILKKHIDSFEICGSYRRKLSHSGDIDVLCTGSKEAYKAMIKSLTNKGILKEYFSYGSSKWLGMGVVDNLHRRIDLLHVSKEEYPFALMYFTGSQEFNEALRGHAKSMGYTLNEHGLKHIDTKESVQHKFNNEKDIFKFLNVNYHEPEERIQGKFKITKVKIASSLKTNEPKDKIQCLKGIGAGGFSIEQIRKIGDSKGLNTKGKKKKELCDMLFGKNVQNNSALFDVNKGVLLAETFKNGNSPIGYYMSEKYDGIRAVWNGVDLRSRTNKIIHAPQWFLDQLPKEYALDGELYLDNGKFENTTSIVSKKVPIDNEWKKIKYMVFDIPSVKKPFEERKKVLTTLKSKTEFIKVVQHILVKNQEQFDTYYTNIISQGGEGVMLIDPKSHYEQKRSKYLLKVKPTHDDEATITNMIEGKGKDIGKLGALVVKKNDIIFKIGTGFNNKLRTQYWKNKNKMKGKLVTFTHKGTTSKGVPRHPVFFRIRLNEKM